ncbi:esterase [Ewingella sp. S1.OA.A_B6]
MIEMYQEEVQGIQLIHAVPAGKYHHLLPTIFFYHGFTSSKEIYSYFGYLLAQVGYRVILPDAPLHGARADGDTARLMASFWDILQSNVDELATLKESFVSRGLADPCRLGVGGVSMGGMTTMASLVRFPWIKAAVCLMGSGYFNTLSERLFPAYDAKDAAQREAFRRAHASLLGWDISGKAAQLAERPLFVWHGEEDDVVPFNESLRLHQEMVASGNDANLTFLAEPGAKHRVSVHASAEATAFFHRHL